MADYRLSRSAKRDLDEIAEFTIKQFGIEQARKYRDVLSRSFETITLHPDIGGDQSHIAVNVRRYVQRPHSVYYRVSNSCIVILRILGPGSDPLRHTYDDSIPPEEASR